MIDHKQPLNIITIHDMRIDEVDSGLPRLTLDASAFGGPGPTTYALAPDAVRALVDALSGVVQPVPGECRVLVRVDAETLGRALMLAKRDSPCSERERTLELLEALRNKTEVSGA